MAELEKIKSYVYGEWYYGGVTQAVLKDSFTGVEFCEVGNSGTDFQSVLRYSKDKGGKALGAMTFPQRGIMLKKLAMHLLANKDKFYQLSYRTGATVKDSWIDIEGGIGNLFSYASLRRNFSDTPFWAEGSEIPLSKDNSFSARNILVPKKGTALHINAYNFPIWGMLEKIAVNLLAGVPAIVKPATSSCYLTALVTHSIIESGILPEGSLQLICGSVGDIFEHLDCQDTVTFTGSFSTGSKLKHHPRILSESIHFNMEADSLNCTILSNDVEPDKDIEFDMFVKECVREITVKCGQKCTAIRRILVPREKAEQVAQAIQEKLKAILPADPREESTRMGALISTSQVDDVRENIQKLTNDSEMIFGQLDSEDLNGHAVLRPMLLFNDKPDASSQCNQFEAFGPVATIMPYNSIEEAVLLANAGKGSLCCSVVTSSPANASQVIVGCGGFHGRILILNKENRKSSTGHGSPLPLLVHGGPGRAGGGEEMGGLLGLKHYMQRISVQGSPNMLSEIAGSYHYGSGYKEDVHHPFTKYFEELRIGETLLTHKRTITESDISNFANLSWDHFYAHTDHTSLDGTIFERPVAHGYLILSAAAGLFVDPKKGTVLLNYGLDECRFIKPVYAGDTIGVRLTVKEKVPRDRKESDLYPQGIVKFLVDVYDQTGETVALATILTMVKAKDELL